MASLAERVRDAILASLYEDPSIRETPSGAKVAEGITRTFVFDPARLETQREEVTAILNEMQRGFFRDTGGGWTFLYLCEDRHGNLWTGLHQICEDLCCLGIALGLVEWCAPRELWPALPGGMPYLVINLQGPKAESAAE